METSLNTIKSLHARDNGFTDWQDLRESVQDDVEYDHHWTAVCVQAEKEALKNAANNVRTCKTSNTGSFYDASVDKATITNEQNLVK